MVSSSDFLRAPERPTAIATLNRQRHLTPSCGGLTPTAERTVGPARISLENLTPRPGIREQYRRIAGRRASVREHTRRSVFRQMITYATSSALAFWRPEVLQYGNGGPKVLPSRPQAPRQPVPMRLFPESQGFHLLTRPAPKPRLAAGGISGRDGVAGAAWP